LVGADPEVPSTIVLIMKTFLLLNPVFKGLGIGVRNNRGGRIGMEYKRFFPIQTVDSMCDDCMQWDEDEEDMVAVDGCTCACVADSLINHANGSVMCKDCRHYIEEEED